MPNDPKEPNSGNVGTWVDCVVKIVGWFQITDHFNSSSGNYRPETNPDGTPISGPGWTAYEKQGAEPGDIVVIYRLTTVGMGGGSLPSGVNLGNILWDLLNPGGLSYFLNSYSLKINVNRSDIISLFPHAGGIHQPSNQNGDLDLLWKRVTTQYDLPGPGNPNISLLIRQVLPGFGIRLVVWTDSCCVAGSVISKPPQPPIIPTPTPSIGTPASPGDPTSPPGGGTLTPVSTVDPNDTIGSVLTPGQPGGLTRGLGDLTYGKGRPGDLPTPRAYKQISNPAFIPRIPGTSSIHYNFNSTYQPTIYDSEDMPFLVRYKNAGLDLKTIRKAIPVSSAYMLKSNKYINISAIQRKTSRYNLSISASVLNTIGLNSSVAGLGIASSGHITRQPINTSSGPTYRGVSPLEFDTVSTNSNISEVDVLASESLSTDNNRVDKSTIGGFLDNKKPTKDDVITMDHPYISNIGVQPRNSLLTNINKPLSATPIKNSSKGAFTTNLGGITKRSIDIYKGIQISSYTKGIERVFQPRIIGPTISELSEVTITSSYDNITDTSGRFTVTFAPLSITPLNGVPAILSIITANVQTSQILIYRNVFVVHTTSGAKAYNLGASAFEVGTINPTQPGMYVIVNPTCIPGQGSLPNILANGTTWNFAQLVTSLFDLENNVIAQQTYNFLPAPPGATDILAPNRLPVGLMADLDMVDTSSYLYEGTASYGHADQSQWFLSEPSVVVQRIVNSTNSTVSIVLKATRTALEATPSFKPLLEIYNDNTLITNQNAITSFVGGRCNSRPGWINPVTNQPFNNGGIDTSCIGGTNLGGAGGTSAYRLDQYSNVISGPYNPGVYGGTHQCFLCFKYNSNSSLSDSSYINSSTRYRIRVYNNGPYSNLNGYVLYTQGLMIVPSTASLSIDSNGYLTGTITTYHCCQILRVSNLTTGLEIERFSTWDNGTIYIGNGTTSQAGTWTPETRLAVNSGDKVRVFRPGYDNLYTSENFVVEFTVP